VHEVLTGRSASRGGQPRARRDGYALDKPSMDRLEEIPIAPMQNLMENFSLRQKTLRRARRIEHDPSVEPGLARRSTDIS
jgi:hypothetical protein